MAKIIKRGKTITVKFDNKRESSNLLRAVGFTSIPASQDNQGKNNMSLELNTASVLVSYISRPIKSVVYDLLVKYGKRDILYIIDECISEIETRPENTSGLTTRAADGEAVCVCEVDPAVNRVDGICLLCGLPRR